MKRFSVSMASALVDQLDRMVRDKGYRNRSRALAEIVRARLVEHHRQLEDVEIAGTITLVYDHHRPNLQAMLTAIQHRHHDRIVSTLHVHLDHDNCLEVLVVRGPARAVEALADQLLAANGVKHGQLTVTATGRDLPLAPGETDRAHG